MGTIFNMLKNLFLVHCSNFHFIYHTEKSAKSNQLGWAYFYRGPDEGLPSQFYFSKAFAGLAVEITIILSVFWACPRAIVVFAELFSSLWSAKQYILDALL